jgi:osmotically-inducible protein OsmY
MKRFVTFKPLTVGILMLLGAALLTACIPVLVATATVTAIDVATDRRTIGRNLDDNTLELTLRKEILLDDSLGGTHISVTAVNGIVLLTGEVSTDSQRRRVTKMAQRQTSTLTVVNEIQLSGSTSITSRANDTAITGKVKSSLLLAKDVPSSAVKVVTEGGKVYLLGLVTRAEGDAAVAATQSVSGITQIIKVFEFIK